MDDLHRYDGSMSYKSRGTIPLRVEGFLFRYRAYILVILCGCCIAAHYWFIGFTSWDGLSYRIPPIVEFVQHGDLGGWKFNYPPAQNFYPFFEWVHVPFLRLFGLTGLYFSFSLILLPLSIASVYAFVGELTGNLRWALYSALAYLAVPFVNTQPFSGYIDFAVIGALAFFLYALLRILRSDKPSLWSLAILSLATFIFSMSRQQTPYLALLITGVLTGWFIAPWDRSLLAKERRRRLLGRLPVLLVAFAIGIAPATYLHIGRYLKYGTPIYPYQFKLFNIATRVGFAQDEAARGAGLIAPDWRGMLASFRRAWLWPGEWPRDFFDSRLFGAGFFFWFVWITMPILDDVIDRDTALLLILFVVIAIVAQDFWLPRWSMTLVLAIVVCIGGTLSWLASNGPSWAYFLLLPAVLVHLVRPVYDIHGMTQRGRNYLRINISESPLFIDSKAAPGELKLYPDLDADFLIIHPVDNEFSLLLYGRELSNRIVGVLDPAEIEDICTVTDNVTSDRQTLIVDHRGKLQNLSIQCKWVCEYPTSGRCLAGRLISEE